MNLSLIGFAIEKLSWVLSDTANRALLRRLPSPSARKAMQIRDTMARRSQEIIEEKKAALAKGDAALAHEVGEGKDIMSVLRQYPHLAWAI